MARPTDSNEQLLCSFCGKSQRQVKKLIAGPGVYICDECIGLCVEIIEQETAEEARDADPSPQADPDAPPQVRPEHLAMIIEQRARSLADLAANLGGLLRPPPPPPPVAPG